MRESGHNSRIARCMQLKEPITTSLPVGLRPMDELLTSRGWRRHQSSPDEYYYNKDNNSIYDEFRICLTDKLINIAVPVANASFLYASKFKSDFKATEFVESHLNSYEESISMSNNPNTKSNTNPNTNPTDNVNGFLA